MTRGRRNKKASETVNEQGGRQNNAQGLRATDVVNDYMDAEGILEEYNLLPPAGVMTFVDVDKQDRAKDVHPRKLFLGGKDSPFQVWAYLKTHPERASEVRIFKEAGTPTSGKRLRDIIGVNEWPEDIELMYPFQALLNQSIEIARPQLDAVIQSYFLEAKEVKTVWHGRPDRFLKNLRLAVMSIAKVYASYPGGVKAVPNTYNPGHIPDSPSDQPVTRQTRKKTASRLKKQPHTLKAGPSLRDSVEPLLKDVNSEIREVGESLSQASLIECRGGDLKQNIRNDLDRARALKEANEAEESTVEELKKKLAEIEEKLKKRRQDRQAEIHAIMHGKTEQDLLNYFQT